jgi:hypothetical protein
MDSTASIQVVPEGARMNLARARDCADYLARKGCAGDGEAVLRILLRETSFYENLGCAWAAAHRQDCERALRNYSEWWGLLRH